MSAVRVRLTAFARSNLPWPVLVQANAQVDGRPVRAQVAASFFIEAGRLLRVRLAEQVTRLANSSAPRQWPAHGASLVEPVPRPVGPPRIVRRKPCELRTCSPDEAALTMDVMDYDFHLFIDADTGQDSMIARVGPTGYRLTRLSGVCPPSAPPAMPMTINVHPVRQITPEQATAQLTTTEMPFSFYRDASTGRATSCTAATTATTP
jgi:hypothetical protein